MKRILYSLIWYNDPTNSDDYTNVGSILSILKNNHFDELYLFRPYRVKEESIYKLKEAKLKEVIKDLYNIPINIADYPKANEDDVGTWKNIFFNSITKCLKEYEDALWYVNFSSGTPEMISALTYALLMIEEPVFSIYINETLPLKGKKYDISKKQIISALDNIDVSTKSSSILPLQAPSILENLSKLLTSHDYSGISILLKGLNNNDLIKMCKGADDLLKLNLASAKENLAFTPLMHIVKNKIPDNVLKLIIYINNLSLELEKHDYFDFVMRTSPLLYELLMTILIDYQKFPSNIIKETSQFSTDIVQRKDINKVPINYRKYFENYFRNTASNEMVMTTSHLMNLVSYQLTSNLLIVQELNELRDFESKIRNEFAHVFSLYTKEYIYSKTNKNPEEIIDLYKAIIKKIAFNDIKNNEYLFDLYQYINQNIYDLAQIIIEN